MFRRPKLLPGKLAQHDEMMGNAFVESFERTRTDGGASGTLTTEYSWPNFRLWIDEELHEYIARNPDTASARLASSEVRRREAWQTPAKWALVVSLFSLAVSAAALLRTL